MEDDLIVSQGPQRTVLLQRNRRACSNIGQDSDSSKVCHGFSPSRCLPCTDDNSTLASYHSWLLLSLETVSFAVPRTSMDDEH